MDEKLGRAACPSDAGIAASQPLIELLVLADLGRWTAQWDALVDASPLPSPFLRSWWLTQTAAGRRQFVLVVQADVLLGGLSLQIRRVLGVQRLRMMGDGPLCPDHLDMLIKPGSETAVVAVIAGWLRRPGCRLVDLAGLRPDSWLGLALTGRVKHESMPAAPWVPLRGDRATYVAARPRGFRKRLRQASSRLTAVGAVHHVRRGSAVMQSLEEYRRIHAAQWGRKSRLLPSFEPFASACRLGAAVDEVAVHELAVGGAPVAIVVAFEVAGRVSLYQSARANDCQLRDASHALFAAIIADAYERGLADVDFLRGTEPYKRNFASERRELVRLQAGFGWAGLTALQVLNAVRTAKRLGARLIRPLIGVATVSGSRRESGPELPG